MLVFNEGVPRSGKSYDCVLNHVLPALKRGRHVFARLNGLEEPKRQQAIADYLKVPLERIQELLHTVDTKHVVREFQCYRDPETGEWRIPDKFKDALVVIDEVHEFYVAERRPLPPEVENFFALLGQNGGDGVVMTQFFQRLHTAVKARIERKNTFQKLSAVGMEGKYLVTYYHSTSPGKFEKVGNATKTYDPAIFPLYRGYADGADNVEVYKEGGTSVWGALAVKGAIFGVVGIAGIAVFFLFFTGNMGLVKGDGTAQVEAPTEVYDLQGNHVATEGVPVEQGSQPVEVIDPYKDLGQGQRYVASLADKGRVRLAARASINDRELAVIEWVDSSGNTVESLDLTQLRELGMTITSKAFGFELVAGDHTIIATPWPRIVQVREQEARLYDTSKAGMVPGSAAFAQDTGVDSGVAVAGTVVPGAINGVGNLDNVVKAPNPHF